MHVSKTLLVALSAADRDDIPLAIPWPMPGDLGGFVTFARFEEWQEFVLGLGLRRNVPEIVAAKFERAQKLFLLAWIDIDLIKAGEPVALTALELALTDRYGDKVRDKQGRIYFSRLLRYLPTHDGLTDDKVRMNIRCHGGSVVDLLTGKRKPSLVDIRNGLAHGYPFDGLPWAGLLELVRDLTEHAYRDWH
jgi:hypothetical protein